MRSAGLITVAFALGPGSFATLHCPTLTTKTTTGAGNSGPATARGRLAHHLDSDWMRREFLRLDVGRGDGEVPVQWLSNANHASRMRLNFGWRFGGGSNLLLGYRFHFLDSWTTGRIFDGIQARFALYW